MKKRVLILAYRFPPFAGTSATRIACFAKYLPEYNWHPSVVTSDWREDNCDQFDAAYGARLAPFVVARIPVGDIRRAAGSDASQIRRATAALRREAIKSWNIAQWQRRARKLLPEVARQHGPFDAILATAPPWAPMGAAAWASRRLGVPWIADFRDIFEESLPPVLWRLRAAQERIALRSCAKILSVSDELVDTLRRRHAVSVDLVPNGFDPDDFAQARAAMVPDPADLFRIVYTGMLYPLGHAARESPRILFAALDRLAATGQIELDKIAVDLIGTPRQKALPHIEGFQCASRVNIIDWVSRQESYRRQISASMLLLLGSARLEGILTAKVYEYLASSRPILAIPSDGGCLDELLRSTAAGSAVSTTEQCGAVVLRQYTKWLQGGNSAVSVDKQIYDKYSRRFQAGQLAGHLNDLMER